MTKRKRSISPENEKTIIQYFNLYDEYEQLEKKIKRVGDMEDDFRVQGNRFLENQYNQQWNELVDKATELYRAIQISARVFNEVDVFSPKYEQIRQKTKNSAHFRQSLFRANTTESLSPTTTLETNSQNSLPLNTPATLFCASATASLGESSFKKAKLSH